MEALYVVLLLHSNDSEESYALSGRLMFIHKLNFENAYLTMFDHYDTVVNFSALQPVYWSH